MKNNIFQGAQIRAYIHIVWLFTFLLSLFLPNSDNVQALHNISIDQTTDVILSRKHMLENGPALLELNDFDVDFGPFNIPPELVETLKQSLPEVKKISGGATSFKVLDYEEFQNLAGINLLALNGSYFDSQKQGPTYPLLAFRIKSQWVTILPGDREKLQSTLKQIQADQLSPVEVDWVKDHFGIDLTNPDDLQTALNNIQGSQNSPIRDLSGFKKYTLHANDDASTESVPIGFALNFFGKAHDRLYVNNNGNITFDQPQYNYTPYDLTSTNREIIAAFFADVDTRPYGSSQVTYGTATISGRKAFGVNYVDVGYYGYHSDKLNSFQLILIDRSDIKPGNFDIEFNYENILWETGDASWGHNGFGGASARVGYSNGTGQPGSFKELAGSGVNGAFLDSNGNSGLIHHSYNSDIPGRYVFQARNGLVERKPPVILVHGFQGLSLGYSCNIFDQNGGDIQEFNPEDPSASNPTLGTELPQWFVDNGYEVWIAHIKSSIVGTPLLEFNALCLKNQINYVYAQNPQKIILVAHSMGGLVSRAAITYMDDPQNKISDLFTMGTPHAGLPSAAFILLGFAAKQNAVKEMSAVSINGKFGFNGRTPNQKDIQYHFIAGTANPHRLFNKLYKNKPNDGLVSAKSAIGLNDDNIYNPSSWVLPSMPNQYNTDEVHSTYYTGNVYYASRSDQANSIAFRCIISTLRHVNIPDCVALPPSSIEQSAQVSPFVDGTPGAAFTEIKSGTLGAGESNSINLTLDTDTSSFFYLTWEGAKPEFTLKQPDATLIDPAYALANPEQVEYLDNAGSPDLPPSLMYQFSTTQSGTWTLNISSSDATKYAAFAVIDSSRSLTVETDANIYNIGDNAQITANLQNGVTGISGAEVVAKIIRSDSVVDTVPLLEQGNGIYSASYVIPPSSGYLMIEVTAVGNDSGTGFSRHQSNQVSVKANDISLVGDYVSQPNDENSDGLYENLSLTSGVNVQSSGQYAVSADLFAGDQLVVQSGGFFDLSEGLQNLTISFDGNMIRQSKLNGPYTITNLQITGLSSGITSATGINIHQTLEYDFNLFGAFTCYPLTLNQNGSGSALQATPANSEGCTPGTYSADSIVNLTAAPDPGWVISGWSGTGNDSSTMTNNSFVMPALAHLVSVNYDQPPFVTSITRVDENPTHARTYAFMVTFTEAVTGFDSADLIINTTGDIEGSLIASIQDLGLGEKYLVSILTSRGFGTLDLDLIDNDTILDFAQVPLGGEGQNNADFTNGESYNIQKFQYECINAVDIDTLECEALVELYNVTAGTQWNDDTGWIQNTTPCSWYGVTCVQGHVSEISLGNNNLVGTIPPELGSLSQLQHLVLDYNQLSGAIPPELGSLSKLQFLILNNNQLSGAIPPELGSLSQLQYLDLSGNQLSGAIPPELGNLSQLQYLYLGGNQLSGAIPPELGSLSQLQHLDLSGNQLSGAIPPELGSLSQLQHLVLSANQLSGILPLQLTQLNQLSSFYLDCGLTVYEQALWEFLVPNFIPADCLERGLPRTFNKKSPIDKSTKVPLSPTLSWFANPDAAIYELCYYTSACSKWTKVGKVTSKQLSGLKAGTKYYWQVRAVNSAGATLASGGAWSFTTGTAPGAFNKSTPTNGATGQALTPTLKWAASPGAASYELCYATTVPCTSWANVGNLTSKQLTGLKAGTKYYWQVRAVNAFGQTLANASGTPWSFTTGAAPGAFNKATPANNATGIALTPTLKWNASPGATRYELCYAKTATCTSWTNLGTALSKTLPTLSKNTIYYWQVRAVNSFGTSLANGGSWKFTTRK